MSIKLDVFMAFGMLLLKVAIAAELNSPGTREACSVPSDGLPFTQKLEDPLSQACLQAATVQLENCKPPAATEELSAKTAATAQQLLETEVLARLIFSESLSTGYWDKKCNASSSEAIMQSIAWGVVSRVPLAQRNGATAYYDKIFQPSQFRTSFSGKKTNPYAEAFLCPLQEKLSQTDSALTLFTSALKTADQVIQQYRKSGIPSQYQGITNFFYPQSEFFGTERPPWAKNPNPTQNKGYMPILGSDHPCVEFYDLH